MDFVITCQVAETDNGYRRAGFERFDPCGHAHDGAADRYAIDKSPRAVFACTQRPIGDTSRRDVTC